MKLFLKPQKMVGHQIPSHYDRSQVVNQLDALRRVVAVIQAACSFTWDALLGPAGLGIPQGQETNPHEACKVPWILTLPALRRLKEFDSHRYYSLLMTAGR